MINTTPRQEGIPTLFVSGLFQIFTLALLFIALIYRQQGLVLLALLILLMFNGALLWCKISTTGLDCHLVPERERVFPGETLFLKAHVTNNKFMPVWLRLAVTVDRVLLPSADSAPVPASGPSPVETATHNSASFGQVDCPTLITKEVLHGEGGLLWQQQASWRWELMPQQRGIYTAGPARVSTGDLFGFYHQDKAFSQSHTLIVYPRLLPLNKFAVPLRELFGSPGIKSPVVDPVYPVATRNYQEGGAARHINWKASARLGQLQEKVFQASAQLKVLLAVDVEGFQKEKAVETFERTLEVAASLTVHLEQQGRTFGLVSNGILKGEERRPAFLPPRRGTGQVPHLLELLARLQMNRGNSMEASLLNGTGLSRGVTCVYFTCDTVKIPDSVLALFQRFHIPVILIVGKDPLKNNKKAPATAPFPDFHSANGAVTGAGMLVCFLETLLDEEAAKA